jgi:hypothetical protein
MEVNNKINAFWDVKPCSLIEIYHTSEEHTASIFRLEE